MGAEDRSLPLPPSGTWSEGIFGQFSTSSAISAHTCYLQLSTVRYTSASTNISLAAFKALIRIYFRGVVQIEPINLH